MSESLKRENCQSNELDDDIEAAEVPEFTRGKVVLCSARHGWATTISIIYKVLDIFISSIC